MMLNAGLNKVVAVHDIVFDNLVQTLVAFPVQIECILDFVFFHLDRKVDISVVIELPTEINHIWAFTGWTIDEIPDVLIFQISLRGSKSHMLEFWMVDSTLSCHHHFLQLLRSLWQRELRIILLRVDIEVTMFD